MISLILFALTLIFIVFSVILLLNTIVFQICSSIGIICLIVWISWMTTDFIKRYLLYNKKIDPKGKSVLITGCDTGFGYETANRLSKKGWHVFACVLSETSDGAKQLESIGSTIIRLDVTRDEDINRAYNIVVEECKSKGTVLWAVVNNAGVMTCGPIEWSNIDEFNRVFQINVYGYVRIIRQFLPLIRKSKGRVVNISSCSALFTAPGITTYSMSKYSISSLCDGLRREMSCTGVSIIEIIPQAYLTHMSFTILGILDRIWSETSPQVKSDFGEQYFKKFRDYIKYYNKNTSDNNNQILNPLIESITLTRVYPKYLCCSPFNRLIMWSFNWLPNEWVDLIVPFCTYRAKPDCLNDAKNNPVDII